jgi:hypothetical protein
MELIIGSTTSPHSAYDDEHGHDMFGFSDGVTGNDTKWFAH